MVIGAQMKGSTRAGPAMAPKLANILTRQPAFGAASSVGWQARQHVQADISGGGVHMFTEVCSGKDSALQGKSKSPRWLQRQASAVPHSANIQPLRNQTLCVWLHAWPQPVIAQAVSSCSP